MEGEGDKTLEGEGLFLKDPPFSLQTSLILQELSPRQPHFLFVEFFSASHNEAVLGKVLFIREVDF